MTRADLDERTRMTAGSSGADIYRAAGALLAEVTGGGSTLVDVGCGQAAFRAYVADLCERYIGADAVRHEGLPESVDFVQTDLDTGRVELADGSADLVTCIETIEHVENPRALVRELWRLVRAGGFVLVTTPNQLSVLSKLSLITKNEFVHFQERPGLYPAHISALLEIDLVRIFRETGFAEIQVRYTGCGRIPMSKRSWPGILSASTGFRGRAFSDNVLVVGRKPVRG